MSGLLWLPFGPPPLSLPQGPIAKTPHNKSEAKENSRRDARVRYPMVRTLPSHTACLTPTRRPSLGRASPPTCLRRRARLPPALLHQRVGYTRQASTPSRWHSNRPPNQSSRLMEPPPQILGSLLCRLNHKPWAMDVMDIIHC